MKTHDADAEMAEQELRRRRSVTYKVALIAAAVSAVPVFLLADSAPWLVAVPICLGTAVSLAWDLIPIRRKQSAARTIFTDTGVLLEALQNNRLVIVSASTILRGADRDGRIFTVRQINHQFFDAQAREVLSSRANQRLSACRV